MTVPPHAPGHAAVVLAAGASSRMGSVKQLLEWRGEPLVRRAARLAVDAGLWPVAVVVDARAEAVRGALAGLPVATVTNPSPADGISSSVRIGLDRVLECAPGVAGVVLLACDQPLLEAAHLAALPAAAEARGLPAAGSAYAGALGVPAWFAAALFPELRALEGDAGARRVLARDLARVAAVPLPHGELDVDTPEDWARAQALARGG